VVRVRHPCPTRPARIREHVERALGESGVRAVFVNGGTGIAPRDTTYEAPDVLFEKRLDGFGELFRMLSVGAGRLGGDAVAGRRGVARGKILASLPGIAGRGGLAMRRLLVPELGHMVAAPRGVGVMVRRPFLRGAPASAWRAADRDARARHDRRHALAIARRERPEPGPLPGAVRRSTRSTSKPSHRLAENDEVAVFPPVSGGS
jgi:molybdopterin biosynthesis enzyme MoaB